MDNREEPTPNEANPSSLEPNPSLIPVPVPITTSSTNCNTEGNPSFRCNKRKTSQIWDHFKKLDGNPKAPRMYVLWKRLYMSYYI